MLSNNSRDLLLKIYKFLALYLDCGPLVVANGVFNGDTVYAGDASVTCSAGYDFSGVVECGSNGNWATPTPTCSAKGMYKTTKTNNIKPSSSWRRIYCTSKVWPKRRES